MRIGLQIGKFDWPGSPTNTGEKLAEIAKAADENGFYSLSVMDHLFQLGTEFGTFHGPVEAAMLEGYSTMSYLAALTRRIKVQLGVTCNLFREPGLLVKAVTTLDVLSGGRACLGIGAGWFEREAKGLGIPFPPLKERFERLEETLQIAKHMWAGSAKPFEGKYYHLAEPICSPQPLSRPHPPIMIGGDGEKKTLRLVAKYGDACNLVLGTTLREAGSLYIGENFEIGAQWLRHKLGVLKRHCDDLERPYNDIEKTVGTFVKLAPDAMSAIKIIKICRFLNDLGIHRVAFCMPNVHEIRPLEIMGNEVIPTVADFKTSDQKGETLHKIEGTSIAQPNQ
jgi:F420-dependent oxidoreductase-like protein